MIWIDREQIEIPNDLDVLIIWKGRYGILNKSDRGVFCSICPSEFSGIMKMDQECYKRIDYWSYLPCPIFRCDQPERSKREDVEKNDGPSHLPDEGWPIKNRFP